MRIPLSRVLPWLGLLAACLPARPAAAALEEVKLERVTDQDAIVERTSGERFRLGLHERCFDLRGWDGRPVLLFTPNGALHAGARLLVPDYDLSCEAVGVDTLAPSKRRSAPPVQPDEGLAALRQALELQGFDCGPPSSPGWTPETADAFRRFREGRELDASPQGIRRAVNSAALEVMRGRQATGTAMRLSRVIADQTSMIVSWLTRAGGATGCGLVTWVRRIDDNGARVVLADGTTWAIAAAQQTVAAGWQDGDEVRVCSGRIVDGRDGTMAHAALAQ